MASFLNDFLNHVEATWVNNPSYVRVLQEIKASQNIGKKVTSRKELMVARKVLARQTLEVTDREWAQAEAEYFKIRTTVTQPIYNNFTLLPKQIGLRKELQKNLKALNGEPILRIAGSDGGWFSSYCYKGMILNAKEIAGGDFELTVVLYPPPQGDWGEDQIVNVNLFEVIQVKDIYIPEAKDLKEEKFVSIVRGMNKQRNTQLINLERIHKDYKVGIEQKEKDIALFKRKINELEMKMKSVKVPNLEKDDVLKLFNQLAKNKKVANAYLTEAGRMVVETRMLYATSPVKNNENKRKPIGRMAMELDLGGIDKCKFTNLDFCYHPRGSESHYPHPNVSGQRICSGSNTGQMDNMLKGGNYYELVDFLIVFFSLFPHDTGAPHVDHMTWLASRRVEKKENPFRREERFWELSAAKAKPVTKGGKRTGKRIKSHSLDELKSFAGTVDVRDGDLPNGNLRRTIMEGANMDFVIGTEGYVPTPPRDPLQALHDLARQQYAGVNDIETAQHALNGLAVDRTITDEVLTEDFGEVQHTETDADESEETHRF